MLNQEYDLKSGRYSDKRSQFCEDNKYNVGWKSVELLERIESACGG